MSTKVEGIIWEETWHCGRVSEYPTERDFLEAIGWWEGEDKPAVKRAWYRVGFPDPDGLLPLWEVEPHSRGAFEVWEVEVH